MYPKWQTCFIFLLFLSGGNGEAGPAPAPTNEEQRVRAPQQNSVGGSTQPRDHLPEGAENGPREPLPASLRCDRPDRLGTSRIVTINPALGPLHIGFKTYPQTLKLRDHEVVLTFDDGPAADTSAAILDALREECVKATFFVVGQHAAQFPELVQRELGEYHTVGHHSNTHPPITLRGLDETSGREEIDDGIEAVERAAYGNAALPASHPHVPFFRFPGFADTPALLSLLDRRRIAVFGTDLWASDWQELSPEYERRHVIALLERSAHHFGIVLFHDTRPSTAAMLPSFLRDLDMLGYRIVHLVPATPDNKRQTLVARAPKGWKSETEKIIAHAWPRIDPGAKHSLSPSHGHD